MKFDLTINCSWWRSLSFKKKKLLFKRSFMNCFHEIFSQEVPFFSRSLFKRHFQEKSCWQQLQVDQSSFMNNNNGNLYSTYLVAQSTNKHNMTHVMYIKMEKNYQQFNKKLTHNVDINKDLSRTMWKMHTHSYTHTHTHTLIHTHSYTHTHTLFKGEG